MNNYISNIKACLSTILGSMVLAFSLSGCGEQTQTFNNQFVSVTLPKGYLEKCLDLPKSERVQDKLIPDTIKFCSFVMENEAIEPKRNPVIMLNIYEPSKANTSKTIDMDTLKNVMEEHVMDLLTPTDGAKVTVSRAEIKKDIQVITINGKQYLSYEAVIEKFKQRIIGFTVADKPGYMAFIVFIAKDGASDKFIGNTLASLKIK